MSIERLNEMITELEQQIDTVNLLNTPDFIVTGLIADKMEEAGIIKDHVATLLIGASICTDGMFEDLPEDTNIDDTLERLATVGSKMFVKMYQTCEQMGLVNDISIVALGNKMKLEVT